MASAVEIEQLHTVFNDHPWLIDALREADWWKLEDGTVRFHAVVPHNDDTAAGFAALAETLGCELRVGGEEAEDPDGEPVAFDDLRQTAQ